MSNITYEKKQRLVRNVLAYVGAIILVILFILVAPLYDILEEFKITFTNNTMSQITTKYTFVVVVAAFLVFTLGFYFIKRLLLFLQKKLTKRNEK